MDGVRKYSLSILWSLFTLFLCGINGNSLPHISFELFELDKLAHMGLFGIFAMIIYYEAVWKPQKINKKEILTNTVWAFLISGFYGVIIEALQATVFVNRSFDWADMLADVIGATAVFILYARFRPKSA